MAFNLWFLDRKINDVGTGEFIQGDSQGNDLSCRPRLCIAIRPWNGYLNKKEYFLSQDGNCGSQSGDKRYSGIISA